MNDNCIHYGEEFDCCKLLSDFGQPMPVIQPCLESPCPHYKSKVKPMNELKTEKDKFTCPEVEFLLIDLVDALNDAKLIRESGIRLTYRHNPQKRGIVVHIMQGLEIEKAVIEI